MPPPQLYGLFVSPAQGHLVRRYGTPGHVGAHVVPGKDTVVDPDEVVGIPAVEAVRYSREYQNAIESGSLVPKTAADFAAWKQKLAKRDTDAADALNAAREALAKLTKREPEQVSDTEAYEHLTKNAAPPAGDEGAVQ